MKTVVFDMDGVLINTEPLHYRAWQEAFREEGVPLLSYTDYAPCIGSVRMNLFEIIREKTGVTVPNPEKLSARMAEITADLIEKEGLPRLPGTEEMLKRLHSAGYLLAVASSSPAYAIRGILEALGVLPFFACTVSGEEMKRPKPAPDTFLAASQKLNCQPADCLVVEDSTNGGLAAKAAGMRVAWFRNPDSGPQNIPHAVLELDSWSAENTARLLSCLKTI